jgi:sugar phosphate isomerase/epimerase
MNRQFRLGTTSYIIPDDILPNVKFLGPSVDDIELLLFEVDDDNNLPDQIVINQLNELAGLYNLSYTVHLPLDLRLASDYEQQRAASVDKATRAINATRQVNPWAYVVHLEADENPPSHDTIAAAQWQECSIRSLEELAQATGEFEQLAVENIECYDAELLIPVIEKLPTSICIDAGHFIKVGRDPIPFIREYIDRTRIVHIHGVRDGRDHKGLDLVEPDLLKELVETLLQKRYSGVVTIEVFSEKHLDNSMGLITSLLPDGNKL